MSEVVTEFIYKTANPIIREKAQQIGHQAYINSFAAKRPITAWRNKHESLMNNYSGVKFTFQELEEWVTTNEIQPRYSDIITALYESLKPHYPETETENTANNDGTRNESELVV